MAIKLNETDKQFLVSKINDVKKIYQSSFDHAFQKIGLQHIKTLKLLEIGKAIGSEVANDETKKKLQTAFDEMVSEMKSKHEKNIIKCETCASYVSDTMGMTSADFVANFFRYELEDTIQWWKDVTSKENEMWLQLDKSHQSCVDDKMLNENDEMLFGIAKKRHEKTISDINSSFNEKRNNYSRCIELAMVGSC